MLFIEYVTLQASYLKFLAYINTISRATYIDIYMEENLIFAAGNEGKYFLEGKMIFLQNFKSLWHKNY